MTPPIATATTGAEQRLHELQVAARAAGAATDVSRYAQEAVEQLSRLIGAAHCSIMVVRDGALCVAGSVGLPAEFLDAADNLPIGPHVGTCGAAAARGTTVISADLERDPKWEPFREVTARAGLRACMSVPLTVRDGTVVGTFAAYSTTSTTPDPVMVDLAESHASLVALGLERFEQEARVAEGYGAVVAALSSALDERDEYTGSHSAETAVMALETGRRLGLDAAEMRTLEQTALLHDVGKLGIPTEILHAPRPLTDSEREVMEQHPVIGERILAGIPYLSAVADAVRHEHERWDGGGYPDGLAGEAIPLASRLVFVCDAWHAMTSDRPYRKALGEQRARDELRAHAGRQFDPRAVDAVLQLVGEPAEAVAAVDTQPAASRDLASIASAAGAQDVFVFSAQAQGHYVQIDGAGQGEGWAGNVELFASDERHLADAVREGNVVPLDFAERSRVVGPYYALTAAIAPVGDDAVVVFGSATTSLRDFALDELARLARDAVAVAQRVPPAKRLADELEVLDTVRAIAAVEDSTLERTLSRIADVTARALSCDYGAVLVRDPSGDVRVGTASHGWNLPAGHSAAELFEPVALENATLPLLAQDVTSSTHLPAILAATGATSLHAVRAGAGLQAAIVVVHSEARPRGFTALCQRVARSAGEAAEPVIGRALAAEWMAEDAERAV